MKLTLEVISANGSSLGAGRRKVFSSAGGRIGRGEDCDWVLPSPGRHVSRHHATIVFKFGQFYVKAEGENQVAINNRSALLAFDTPSPVKQGDRLYIDEYEILASVPIEAARPPLIVGDPFADESGPVSLALVADPRDQENLDPLSRLPNAPSRGGATERSYPGLPQGDILSDPFTPPPMIYSYTSPPPTQAPPPPLGNGPSGSAPSIPTDPDAWNRTTYGVTTFQKPEPSIRPQIKPEVAPPLRAPVPQRLQPSPAPKPPAAPAHRPPTNRTAETHPQPPPLPPPRRSPKPAPPDAAPASGFDVDAMLRAAGVDPQEVSAEMAATLGQILLVVVQGTIDALRARDEVKSQFRLAVTRVRVKDNNPLTFAMDAADAINSLLNRRNPAFLPPLEAFQRAFDDIRGHQIAMLAGMRAGFENLMARFDPQQLQEDFDRQVKRSGKLGVGKPKYWDLYADYFAGLRGDREDAFRRLFGEEFAVAYEKQVELIKRSRGDKSS